MLNQRCKTVNHCYVRRYNYMMIVNDFFCYLGIKEEAAFNVAVVELGGHLPIKGKLPLEEFIKTLIIKKYNTCTLIIDMFRNQ